VGYVVRDVGYEESPYVNQVAVKKEVGCVVRDVGYVESP